MKKIVTQRVLVSKLTALSISPQSTQVSIMDALDQRSRCWIITYPSSDATISPTQVSKLTTIPGVKEVHAIRSDEHETISIFIICDYQLLASKLTNALDTNYQVAKRVKLIDLTAFRELPRDEELTLPPPMTKGLSTLSPSCQDDSSDDEFKSLVTRRSTLKRKLRGYVNDQLELAQVEMKMRKLLPAE